MKIRIKLLLLILILTSFCCGDNNEAKLASSNSKQIANHSIAKSIDSIDTLKVCTFNIQFLGHFNKKDNSSLADVLKVYDIVVVQELVAPPYDGIYPDGELFKPDDESKAFFDAMSANGFQYILSDEDTGTNDEIHINTSATEWWVTFYKNDRVNLADGLPSGFLEADRSNNPDFERVPFAFGFRSVTGKLDFVLISVHLQPGSSQSDMNRRQEELSSISQWINTHNQIEKDFIILGDMNIENASELNKVTPTGYLSLNNECRPTNTLQGEGKSKPYDQIMFNVDYTTQDIDTSFDCRVIDLIGQMRNYWHSDEPYPGNPYDHNKFRQYYSDHHPLEFRMFVRNMDDD